MSDAFYSFLGLISPLIISIQKENFVEILELQEKLDVFWHQMNYQERTLAREKVRARVKDDVGDDERFWDYWRPGE